MISQTIHTHHGKLTLTGDKVHGDKLTAWIDDYNGDNYLFLEINGLAQMLYLPSSLDEPAAASVVDRFKAKAYVNDLDELAIAYVMQRALKEG